MPTQHGHGFCRPIGPGWSAPSSWNARSFRPTPTPCATTPGCRSGTPSRPARGGGWMEFLSISKWRARNWMKLMMFDDVWWCLMNKCGLAKILTIILTMIAEFCYQAADFYVSAFQDNPRFGISDWQQDTASSESRAREFSLFDPLKGWWDLHVVGFWQITWDYLISSIIFYWLYFIFYHILFRNLIPPSIVTSALAECRNGMGNKNIMNSARTSPRTWCMVEVVKKTMPW